MDQERTQEMATTIEAPQQLTIDGENYILVKTRTYDPISVYKGENTFLRIGPREKLEQEAKLHEQLFAIGFPLPTILKSGELHDQFYYLERSFEGQTFGRSFAEQCSNNGEIDQATFDRFLTLIERYTQAQLKTARQVEWSDHFYQLTHMDLLTQERPDLVDQLNTVFKKIKMRLSDMPPVLTHDDFNPYNLFPEGIIDIGGFSYAPAGYDVSMNAFHTYMFPVSDDYEMQRRYMFTTAQHEIYSSHIDQLYKSQGLTTPSSHSDDYLVGKMTWSAAQMQHMPKVQAWRYDLLDKMTKAYLEDRSVKNILLTA